MKRLFLAFLFCCALACGVASAQEEGTPTPINEYNGWKWANFAVLVIGLGYLMAKSLPPLLRSRTDEIQKGIREAQALKQDAERRAAAVEAKLAALGADIEKFRTQARAEMEQEGARIAENTKRHLEKLQQQAELEIETAGKIAQRELRAHAAKLALELAESRIRTMLDPKHDGHLNQELVSEFVRDLGASKN
jgi:F-type H+-transporting ATPase subunit b